MMSYGDTIVNGHVRDFSKLCWQPDWNGDEVGYDNCPVVGLYTVPGLELDIYVDTETGVVLEGWYQPE